MENERTCAECAYFFSYGGTLEPIFDCLRGLIDRTKIGNRQSLPALLIKIQFAKVCPTYSEHRSSLVEILLQQVKNQYGE